MCKCIKTGKELPERDSIFSGYECRWHDRFGCRCQHFSHYFADGTNCLLLRKPINVRAILKIGDGNHDT